jgi:hypothetical protein
VVSEKWDRLGPTLEGQLVRVEPLAEAHEAELREAAGDPDIWRWLPLNAGSSAELFHRWLLDALERKDAGAEAPFVIVDRATGVAIGSTRFLALRPWHRRSGAAASTSRPSCCCSATRLSSSSASASSSRRMHSTSAHGRLSPGSGRSSRASSVAT